MPTAKKRLNISLSPDIEATIKRLSVRDKMPQATKITQLLQVALENEEDQLWDALAERRDEHNAKFIPHKKAWA